MGLAWRFEFWTRQDRTVVPTNLDTTLSHLYQCSADIDPVTLTGSLALSTCLFALWLFWLAVPRCGAGRLGAVLVKRLNGGQYALQLPDFQIVGWIVIAIAI